MTHATLMPPAALAEAIAAHRRERSDARVAFVLQPGGAAGAYQAGALLALHEHGVRPDLIVGSSSGALNALGWLLDALAPAVDAQPPTRLSRLWRRLSHQHQASALLFDKAMLVEWLSGRPQPWLHWLQAIASRLPHLPEDVSGLHDGLFTHERLRGLLVHEIKQALGGEATPRAAGQALIEAVATHPHAPNLVLTVTDVHQHLAVPLVLGDPAIAQRLFARGWPAAMLGHGKLIGVHVLEAFLASASIPAIFPSVRLPLAAGQNRACLDGAIGTSEPFHLAIDAGATLLLSLEVESWRSRAGQAGEPGVPAPLNAAEAFLTVQERYQCADARGVAFWNRALLAGAQDGRALVPLYRHLPHRREIGLLDFEGRYEDGRLACSLFDWFMAGYRDAGGEDARVWSDYVQHAHDHGDTKLALGHRPPAGFWDATFWPSPSLVTETHARAMAHP